MKGDKQGSLRLRLHSAQKNKTGLIFLFLHLSVKVLFTLTMNISTMNCSIAAVFGTGCSLMLLCASAICIENMIKFRNDLKE